MESLHDVVIISCMWWCNDLVIIPCMLTHMLLRGAAGSRALTILPIDRFCTKTGPDSGPKNPDSPVYSILQFFQLLEFAVETVEKHRKDTHTHTHTWATPYTPQKRQSRAQIELSQSRAGSTRKMSRAQVLTRVLWVASHDRTHSASNWIHWQNTF